MPNDFRNYDPVPAPGFAIDIDPLIHAAVASDKAFPPAVSAALADYDAACRLVGRLQNLLDARQARADLAAQGFNIGDEEFETAFETFSTAEEKDRAKGRYFEQIRRRLEAQLKPHADRVARAAIDELRADLPRLAVIDPVLAKYGAPASPLAVAIKEAVAKIEKSIADPLSLAWHYDVRMAISQGFYGPQVSTPCLPTTPTPAAGNLASAAELAMQAAPPSPLATRRPINGGWKTIT
jgi:hypothetical protein